MIKPQLRQVYREIRKALPDSRRIEAAHAFQSEIEQIAPNHRYVLSYASFNFELDTGELNKWLAEAGKLALPKVQERRLTFFHVEHPAQDLILSSWGIWEPDPTRCKALFDQEASLVLVPGLAFDQLHHRLGYGTGCYDRFLAELPSTALTIGIGFKEQLYASPLPVEPSDIRLTKLLLT